MCQPVESEGARMINAGKHTAAVNQRGKNVSAGKGGKIYNHRQEQERENINGDMREKRRAQELIPFRFNRRTFRAHLLARLKYFMEIYRWTAV